MIIPVVALAYILWLARGDKFITDDKGSWDAESVLRKGFAVNFVNNIWKKLKEK